MAEKITPGSVTILIVEDDPVTQKTVAMFMARAGFDSTFASNGVEALEKVVENPPDLIISDVMMPEMDVTQQSTDCQYSHHPAHR